jgi:hypothetical protein
VSSQRKKAKVQRDRNRVDLKKTLAQAKKENATLLKSKYLP